MRIIHVADFKSKQLGLRTYGTFSKIHNGFIRNGHDVFHFSDHDIARASNPFGTRKLGIRACNTKLIKVCENIEPEVLVLAHADLIHTETIFKIRKKLPNLLVIQYNIDALFMPHNFSGILEKSKCVDHTFMTTAGPYLSKVAGASSGVSYIPNCVDPSIDVYRNHEMDDLDIDVFFAGALHKYVANDDLRRIAPAAIKKRLPHIRCSFYDDKNKLFGIKYKVALSRSRIGLNFSARPDGMQGGVNSALYLYSSDRIGSYMGNGLLTFTSSISDLSDLYGKDCIVEVSNKDELLDRIQYFMEHDNDRKRIAANGHNFVHRECNEKLVTRYMLEAASKSRFTHQYVWPTETYYR